jgi:hypothetical protein
MKTFTQFIVEQTELTVSEFPLLSALPRGHERIIKILAVLNPALKAGSIANVFFQDAKSQLSQLNDAMRNKIGSDYTHSGKWDSLPEKLRDIELTFGDPHHIPGKVKKLEKFKDEHPMKTDYLAYAKEMVVLVDAFASLKDKIVKRQPKSEEEKALQAPTYIPPSASHGAMGVVLKVLTQITNETKVKFSADLEAVYVRQVEGYMDQPPTRKDLVSGKHRNMFADMIMNRVGKDYDSFESHYKSLEPNWTETVKKMADREADDVQQGFLAKNVRKLAKIIEDKGNMKGEPKVLRAYVMPGGFGGEIQVYFEDGAKFTVRNKAVHKISERGKQFLQFPTTFHDVMLANDKPMSTPSEERMIEVFAKTKGN